MYGIEYIYIYVYKRSSYFLSYGDFLAINIHKISDTFWLPGLQPSDSDDCPRAE